jgi:hypothetical protein
MLHGLRELLCWQRIQDVVFGQPGTPRLKNTVADFVEVRGVV